MKNSIIAKILIPSCTALLAYNYFSLAFLHSGSTKVDADKKKILRRHTTMTRYGNDMSHIKLPKN